MASLLLLPAAAARSWASSGRIGRRSALSSVYFDNNHRSSSRHHHHHPSSSSSYFVHRGSSPRSIAHPRPTPASGDVGRPYSSSSSSSSSSYTSFEAPEPPSSHGASVFPDIEFRRSATTTTTTTTGEEKEAQQQQQQQRAVATTTTAATTRNADRDAVFVVNGSSRGIGLRFVVGLLERTEGKVLACCRSPSTAIELIDLSSRYPDRVVVLPLDVEDQESIDDLARTIATEYRRVDLLLNVAGILGDGGATTPGPERSLSKLDRDWLMKTMSVNAVGPTMLARALSPLMRTKGGRRTVEMMDGLRVDLPLLPPGRHRPPTVIVNLSARVGSISDNLSGGWYSYRMSKSALNQATRTMGHELARQGTWIVALHPGTTDTGLSRPFRRNVGEGRLFPVEFTVDRLLDVIESLDERNTGGFYDWAGKALPF
ncbi:hypothetical protein ACHAW5_001326 [Stephanodiscus triporus]|uniref:Uncharacterized protein n=1 Tax=Stephanodiscus triporus TaxID=2934178 RepID=A0ABD3Q3J3_9STRA